MVADFCPYYQVHIIDAFQLHKHTLIVVIISFDFSDGDVGKSASCVC